MDLTRNRPVSTSARRMGSEIDLAPPLGSAESYLPVPLIGGSS